MNRSSRTVDRRWGVSYKTRTWSAQVAQSVEQWTENPRVRGSIPRLGTTSKTEVAHLRDLIFCMGKAVERCPRYNPLMTKAKVKLGILISGRGSNMKAIVEACESGEVPATVERVISNRQGAPGIDWARDRGIECRVLPHRDFESREAHDRAVVGDLKAAGVQWVCLAGYMRLLSPWFVEAFPQRILNIHPSLLPAFPGLSAQTLAWDYGVGWTGCTVHLVDAELDHGPIVGQQAVPVEPYASVEDLQSAILEQEHLLYVRALRRLLSQEWRLDGRRIVYCQPS